MKIIEAMKELKALQEKAADLRAKVAQYCANLDFETPTYPDQAGQIRQWIQSHEDTIERIAHLRTSIKRTNLATQVTIELAGKRVTHSIAYWIERRGAINKKDGLASLDRAVWDACTDRNLKEGQAQNSVGTVFPVKIRRYFDPAERDRKQLEYKQEPSLIDAKLEVVNAITELIEKEPEVQSVAA
jgi:hypothetical protein